MRARARTHAHTHTHTHTDTHTHTHTHTHRRAAVGCARYRASVHRWGALCAVRSNACACGTGCALWLSVAHHALSASCCVQRRAHAHLSGPKRAKRSRGRDGSSAGGGGRRELHLARAPRASNSRGRAGARLRSACGRRCQRRAASVARPAAPAAHRLHRLGPLCAQALAAALHPTVPLAVRVDITAALARAVTQCRAHQRGTRTHRRKHAARTRHTSTGTEDARARGTQTHPHARTEFMQADRHARIPAPTHVRTQSTAGGARGLFRRRGRICVEPGSRRCQCSRHRARHPRTAQRRRCGDGGGDRVRRRRAVGLVVLRSGGFRSARRGSARCSVCIASELPACASSFAHVPRVFDSVGPFMRGPAANRCAAHRCRRRRRIWSMRCCSCSSGCRSTRSATPNR